ncbi:MAG: hypothetical protein AB7O96_12080, partial [Pseudobdellovibrionaceae bacterium]
YPPESIDFTCTVNVKTKQIKNCVWAFAGTLLIPNEKTGAIKKDSKVSYCEFSPKMNAFDFINVISTAKDPLSIDIPGVKVDLYSVLIDCLQ